MFYILYHYKMVMSDKTYFVFLLHRSISWVKIMLDDKFQLSSFTHPLYGLKKCWILNFSSLACQEVLRLLYFLQGSQEECLILFSSLIHYMGLNNAGFWISALYLDRKCSVSSMSFKEARRVKIMLDFKFQPSSFTHPLYGLKQSWILNFSSLACQEVLRLFHILQES